MANLRTNFYEGFNAASESISTSIPGWMFWSGSKTLSASNNNTTVYGGVGLEAILHSSSFFRYSASAAGGGFEVRTPSFFFGSDASFISGSGDGTIAISSSFFELATDGSVTMQGQITATAGGTIGGWKIGSTFISSSNNTIALDSAGPYHISSSGFQINTDGSVTASKGLIAGWLIDSDKIHTPNLHLSSSYGLKVFQDENANYLEMKYLGIDDWGLKGVLNGQNLFQLGDTNQIAGWKFDNSKIISNLGAQPGIVLKAEGTIESNPFISGLTANATGWQIRADGRAEFENAVIRGTLSTAVFEKDTISVVGGQVMVANAAKLDKPEERFKAYPYVKSPLGHNLNLSGEELPIDYSTPNSTVTANEISGSNLYFKIVNTGANKGKLLLPFSTGSMTEETNLRISFYAGHTATSNLEFNVINSDSTQLAFTGSNNTVYSTTQIAKEGLNVFYAKTQNGYPGGKLVFKNSSATNTHFAYMRDLHVMEVSQSLTVDNAGGFAPGEIVVIKSTDQGPDGREGFVREYVQIISSSLGGSASPASGTFNFNTITNDIAAQRYTVTSSEFYHFTASSTGQTDQPALSRYYFELGSNKTHTISNLSAKINAEVLDVYTTPTGSGTSLYMQSVDQDSEDGNSFGIKVNGGNSLVLVGAEARVKPTLTMQRNMDALVEGNERGYFISKMKDGQSMASQGGEGTGYILMNAQPTDDYSPYIDIVERQNINTGSQQHTGDENSSVFGDVKTIVRIGDLGGITDYDFSDGVNGYGIYTQNGYFKGKVEIASLPAPPSPADLMHHYKMEGLQDAGISAVGNASYRGDGAGVNKSPLTASIFGNPTYTTGYTGTSLKVFGRATGLNISAHQARFGPGADQSGSIVWWHRVDNFSAEGFGGGFGTHTYNNYIDVQTTRLRVEDNTGTNYYLNYPVSQSNTSIGEWNHYAVVFTEGGLQAYKNGLKGSYVAWDANTDWVDTKFIGTSYQMNTLPYMTASMDDVRIYDTDLSSRDVESLYLGGDGLGGTIIEGNRIQTGKLQSNNWTDGGTKGSIINLDSSEIKMGGDTSPKLHWNPSTEILSINGVITLGAGSVMPDGNPINNLKSVSLESTSQIFTKNIAGTINPANIGITASLGNTLNTTLTAASWSTVPSITLVDGVDQLHKSITPTNFGSNTQVQVSVTADNGAVTDSFTILLLDEGSGNVQTLLSNPVHSFLASNAGGAIDFNGSGTTIRVFEGITELDYDNAGTTAGHYDIALTAGTGVSISSLVDSGLFATLPKHTAMTETQSAVNFLIEGKTLNGANFTQSITQSLIRSDRGEDGTDGAGGATGADAKGVSLSGTAFTIAYDANGLNPSPATITLQATSSNINDTYFKFTGGGGAFTDEGSFTNGTGAAVDSATFNSPINYSVTPYNFRVGASTSSSPSSELASDTITIASLRPGQSGSSAYTVVLTNDSHTLAKNAAGTITYAGSGTTIKVFKGITELNGITSAATNAGKFSVTSSGTNISPSSVHGGSSGNPVIYTDHGSYSGTANASIVYSINIEDDVTITKQQSFALSIEGQDGANSTVPGPAGPNFDYLTSSLATINTVAINSANPNGGLMLADEVLGFHNAFAGNPATINDFSTYMDNGGNFYLGSASGNLNSYLAWNQSAGSLLISGSLVKLDVDQFFMGQTGSTFISGAAGGLQISSSQFHLREDGTAIFQGSLQIGAPFNPYGTGLFPNPTFDAGFETSASVTLVKGARNAYSNDNPATIFIRSSSVVNPSGEPYLQLDGLGSDGALGVAFTAFQVDPQQKYRIQCQIRGEAVDTNGFYLRMQEIDTILPADKIAICWTGSNTIDNHNDVQPVNLNSGRQVSQLLNSGANFRVTSSVNGTVTNGRDTENGPMGTNWEEFDIEYTPYSATAKHASLAMLNWSSISSGHALYMRRLQITPINSSTHQSMNGVDGTIGGLSITATSIEQGSSFKIDGSGGTGPGSFISSSKFKVSSTGQVSMSALLVISGSEKLLEVDGAKFDGANLSSRLAEQVEHSYGTIQHSTWNVANEYQNTGQANYTEMSNIHASGNSSVTNAFWPTPKNDYIVIQYFAGLYSNTGYSGAGCNLGFRISALDPNDSDTLGGAAVDNLGAAYGDKFHFHSPIPFGFYGDANYGGSGTSYPIHFPGVIVIKNGSDDGYGNVIDLHGKICNLRIRGSRSSTSLGGNGQSTPPAIRSTSILGMNEIQLQEYMTKIHAIDSAHHIYYTGSSAPNYINTKGSQQNTQNTQQNYAQAYQQNVAPKCFLIGTRILLANGNYKSIEKIELGDLIMDKDNNSSRVIDSFVHNINRTIRMYTNGKFKVTGTHLLFVNDKWQTAKDLNWESEMMHVNNLYYLQTENGYIVEKTIVSGVIPNTAQGISIKTKGDN